MSEADYDTVRAAMSIRNNETVSFSVAERMGSGHDALARIEADHTYWREVAQAYEFDLGRLDKMRAENDALRGIAARIMPCHYCGAEEVARCPRGFPGCALMDDLFCAEASAVEALRKERAENERLRTALRFYADENAYLWHWNSETQTRGAIQADDGGAVARAALGEQP